MKTIIFKWNPSFSSYTLTRFLNDLGKASEQEEEDRKSNWSVYDHDKVNKGDRFYMLKVGYGQIGIVARGIITSDAYMGEDWSWNDRPRWYVDYLPEIMINPDAFTLLTSEKLSAEIPSMEWTGGHSGIVLSDEDAEKLEQMWENYMESHKEVFEKASDDNLFIDISNPSDEEGAYKITFDRDYDDNLNLYISSDSPYYDNKILHKNIRIFDVVRLMKKLRVASKRMLASTIYTNYPNDMGLA